MRLVALQSNYIPWKGYFDLMSIADLFVVYDSVQFTKNDWRNRNTLRGPDGPIWLTIPCRTAGRAAQRISETEVTDGRWALKHWRTVQQTLGKAPGFATFADEWESWYVAAADLERLHEVNLLFLRGLARQLSIDATIRLDTEFDSVVAHGESSATGRLVDLCREAGATTYVTGPAGLSYMDLSAFEEVGVTVEVIDYGRYDEYPQLRDEFTHSVSVLDLLANVGNEGPSHLKGVTTRVV